MTKEEILNDINELIKEITGMLDEKELLEFKKAFEQSLKILKVTEELTKKLDGEVEIIEDTPKEDKKIEKLDLIFEDKFIKEHFKNNSISYLDTYTTLKKIYEKQCEIIDKLNGE